MGDLRLALSLGSGQHRSGQPHFSQAGKRLQDLQAGVGQPLAPPHSALQQAQNNVQGSEVIVLQVKMFRVAFSFRGIN